ncbi:hypothetical protein P154DRAFT_35386 [Amniculicola lignicola CBS 123094]|uniref:Uncharacterized protein n=1 Tax=Amniculicola lignicola CBS 123094 TaxID=1392246 RepID=A0A6A5WRZ5_9PLEO|nr:hypothetical protein P154DRAFT_35386 [Amniculicola lignicola CBS 123094]
MNSSILPIVPPSLLPLTTPFIPPPDCSDIFITTHTVTSYSWNNYTETTLTALYSDPGSEQFTRCQPPGWDKVISKSRFHFSPAVCPDQWTAYNLEAVYVDVPTLTKRATTAFCCAR